MRLILLLLCLTPALAFGAPRVVTSIAPLFELTAAVMDSAGRPEMLISDGGDVHHFAFKPSQLRLLQRADLVIWVDRRFENGFDKLPGFLPAGIRQLELLPLLADADSDGHIWFSPLLLIDATTHISQALQQIDPANAARYQANAQQLREALLSWRKNQLPHLQSIKPAFITEHDFLQHFSTDMGIAALASLQNSHDQPGSLAALTRLETLLRQSPVACLLSLEAEPSALASNLARKFSLQIININPVLDTKPGQLGILRRFDRLAQVLSSCAI